jgi:hypothetical protein
LPCDHVDVNNHMILKAYLVDSGDGHIYACVCSTHLLFSWFLLNRSISMFPFYSWVKLKHHFFHIDAKISLGESNNLLAILLHQSPNPQVASNVPQQVSQSKPPNASENQLIFRASLSDLCSHTCQGYQIQAQALYLLHDS